MLDLNSFILAGIFILTLLLYRRLCLPKHKHYPPGPQGFPIVGHLPLLGTDPPGTFEKWRAIYGDIFRIRMGSWDTVVINRYSLIKEAMDRNDDAFSGRPKFTSMALFPSLYDGNDSFGFGSFNEAYKQVRKIATTAIHRFTNTRAGYTQDIVHEEVNILVEQLLSMKDENPIVDETLQLSVGSIIYQVLYGRGQNVRENELFKAYITHVNEFMTFAGSGNQLDVMPWLRFIVPWKLSRMTKLLMQGINANKVIVNEHKETFIKGNIRDVTDVFLDAGFPQTTNDKTSTATETRLLHTVNDLASAGIETTSVVLNWLIMYMVAYPKIQTRVQQEIDDVVGCGRRVNIEDRTSLPFTEATILEVMRITSVIPFSVPHSATKHVRLNGFNIDKDTVMFLNLHSIHMDEEFWELPEEFSPDRFLKSENGLDQEKCNHVLPFGVGRRRCAGEQLAKMELFLLFSNLLQKCKFSKADMKPMDLSPILGLTYRPKSTKIVVSER